MNREELDLATAEVEALEALAAAKERHRTEGTDASRAALAEAKAHIYELRCFWRGIREYIKPTPAEGDAVATPPLLKVKVK